MAKLQSGTHVYGNTTIDTTLSMGGAILGNLINQSYNQGSGSLQIGGNTAIAGTTVVQNLILQGNNNLLLQSNGFANTTVWTAVANTTVTSAYAVAPDGTVSAYKINTASGNVANGIYQTVTKPTGSYQPIYNYNFSTYAKAAGYTWLQIKITDGTGANGYNYWFDVSNGVVGNTTTLGTGFYAGTSSISLASTTGSGWFRCSSSAYVNANTQLQCYIIPTNANGTTTIGDSNLDGLYVWGSQLEVGTSASPYTNTTTSSVTTLNTISIPNGQLIIPSGSGTSPGLAFNNATSTGLSILNGTVRAIHSGQPVASFSQTLSSFNGTIMMDNNENCALVKDAAHMLAMRIGLNPQTYRVYNNYTDASNYERGMLDWSTTSNTFSIGTQAAGTGTLRNISVVGGNVTVSNTTPSTSNTTGALVVNGGVGIAGQLTAQQVVAQNIFNPFLLAGM